MIDTDLLTADKKVPRYTLSGRIVYAKCVNVYDGDTAQFVFRLDQGAALYRYSCRMQGYNSAEINGATPAERERAQSARQALSSMILNQIVVLYLGKFDKYGRPLVNVKYGDIDVNAWMLECGHGAPYCGRGEKKW